MTGMDRKRREVGPAVGVAVYHARIAIHGIDRLAAPTISEIESAVSKGVVELLGADKKIVNVDATRTDL